jgi:hypothetical protein
MSCTLRDHSPRLRAANKALSHRHRRPVGPALDLDGVHELLHQREAVPTRPKSPMLPRTGVVNLEGEKAVDHGPVDVDLIERGILRMLDRIHERFRDRRQDGEDLVLGRAVLAEPDANSPSQSGGKLGSCLEPKLERGGFWATHLSLPCRGFSSEV